MNASENIEEFIGNPEYSNLSGDEDQLEIHEEYKTEDEIIENCFTKSGIYHEEKKMEDEESNKNDLCNEEQMNITFDTANESLNQLVRYIQTPSNDVGAIDEDDHAHY